MSRIGLLIAAAALALTPAPSAQAAAPARVALLACEAGDAAAAEFGARMATVPGAARLSMRFILQARTPGRRGWWRVPAPGFDEWTTADPGVTRYSYARRVEELIAPARYRVWVRFVWRDAAGQVVEHVRRRSRACRQPDPRPDLVIRGLVAEDGRYLARVRNRGRGAAGPFAVRIGDEEIALAGLGARRDRVVELPAAPCEPGADVVAEADPHGAVDERSERNNERAIACPEGV